MISPVIIPRGYRHLISATLAELGIPEKLIEQRRLPVCPEATELAIAEVESSGREHRLTPETAAAWSAMRRAAAADGIELHIVSAFRSFERQAELIRRKLERGLSLEEILAVSAPPGYSEHHTGRAVDIGCPGEPPLEDSFERTDGFSWLLRYAGEFGFTLSYPRNNRFGYSYEPWHWAQKS
jgi:D-alanyl-D-alanine carboxypeptidase